VTASRLLDFLVRLMLACCCSLAAVSEPLGFDGWNVAIARRLAEQGKASIPGLIAHVSPRLGTTPNPLLSPRDGVKTPAVPRALPGRSTGGHLLLVNIDNDIVILEG